MEKKFRTSNMNVHLASCDTQENRETLTKSLSRIGSYLTGRSNRSKHIRNRQHAFEELEQRQLLSVTAMEDLICVDPVYDSTLNGLSDNTVDRSTLQNQLTASGLTLTEKDILNLNSVPGAKATIYLDFNGHTTSGTTWNTIYNEGEDFVTPRFTMDGDTTKTTFSSEELWAIYEIWLRVSEDYAPFEVNVTTKDPGAEALTYNGSGDNAWGKRVCIGGSCDDWLKESCGGIAYMTSFYSNAFQGIETPCYVFTAGLGTTKNIAEAATHESGHTLGLNHDGNTLISGQEEYYYGANGWCPIMGAGYYQPLTQWAKGEYSGATNKEDDLNIIATSNGFTYKADDFGNDIESAYKLSPRKGVIAEGLIETRTDYDFFEINITGKPLELQVSGLPGITNLDIGVSLYDAQGNLLETYAPSDALYVTMDLAGYVGTHYISVTGTGNGSFYTDYASLGAYTLEILNDYVDETVIVVTTERDIVSATDGQTSLREAIAKSASIHNGVILFASDLKGKTLSLSSELKVTNTVTIDASALYDKSADTYGITINGSGSSRIFNISNKAGSTANISLNSLLLTGGRTNTNGGALLVTGTEADALTVSLTNCLVTGNTSISGSGGGLYATNATVNLTDTVVSLNDAGLYGGGIYVAGGSFSMLRGSVSENKVTYGDGGGLYIAGNTDATLTDTLVFNNDAKKTGGGLYIAAIETQSEDPTISLTNTNITQNSAMSDGGGLFVAAGILLTDCTIDKNDSLIGNGGGFYFAEGSSKSVLTNSIIKDNYTRFDGGGIYTTTGLTLNGMSIWNNLALAGNGGGIAAQYDTTLAPSVNAPVLKISSSDISSNAVYEGNGAGLWLVLETEIADSTILGNNASAGYGAGIYAADKLTIQRSRFKENATNRSGAALYFTGSKNLVVANTEIASNAATINGAGVYFASTGKGVITNNTIVANYVQQGVGAGVYAANANLAVYNSIIVENYNVIEETKETGTTIKKTVSNLDSSTPNQSVIVGKYNISNFDYWADAEECLVYDNMPQFFFEDFEGGDYHILFISDALNAGNNDYVRGDSDLDGLLRICYNPDVTWRPFAVDVGAYEYQEISGNDEESPFITSPNWHTPACKADGHNAILKWTTTSYRLNNAVSYNLVWTARFADGDMTSGTVVVPASGDGIFIDYTFVPPFTEAATISFTVQGNVNINGKLVRSNVSPILILSVDKLPGSATQLDSPINLTVTATGTDSVELNWIAGRSNNKYEIEYSTSSRFSAKTTTKIEVSANTRYELTELSPNTTYFVRMRQIGDGIDTITSQWTSNCLATTWSLPLTPGKGNAVGIGADQLKVTLDAIEGAASYLVEYSMNDDFADSKMMTVTSNLFNLSGLDANTTYYMRYKVNSMGGMTSATWSESFLASTTSKLTTPYNIKGTGTSSSSEPNTSVIYLTWNDSPLVESYTVQYRLAGKEEWSTLDNVTQASAKIEGLQANAAYEIHIMALANSDDLSDSEYSAIVTIATPVAPVSTDILLSSQYVQSNADDITLVGKFNNTYLTDFELMEEKEDNSLFEIVYDPDNGFELYTKESLDDGVYTISVKAKKQSDSQWLADPQILEITAYRPEVTANMTKVNTAEERSFSLSGIRIDDTDTQLTWNWKYTKDGGEVVRSGQTVEFTPGDIDLPVAPDTEVQIELYAVDQNGIQSESEMITVIFDDKANLVGTLDESLSQFNILKLKLDTQGTTAQSWTVNWGDNTSTQVDVRSSSLSLAHYYAIPDTYNVTYSITTVGGVVIESDPTNIQSFTVNGVATPILMPEETPEEIGAETVAVESVLPSLLPEETESQLFFANTQSVEVAPIAVPLAPDFFTASRFGRGCGLFSLNADKKDRTGILAHNDDNDFYRDIASHSAQNGVNTTLDNYFESEFEADLVDLWS